MTCRGVTAFDVFKKKGKSLNNFKSQNDVKINIISLSHFKIDTHTINIIEQCS